MNPQAQRDTEAKPLGPILTAHLFAKIERLLIELLRSLRPDEWEAQTVSPRWKVRDVAAHLLDTQLRKLSIVRDGYVAEAPVIRSQADLIAFVDRINREGVTVYRRLSPAALISLMEVASRKSAEYHESLDPFAPAAFAVSWAGEETSPNWFDTAREFTERWHHQQQIRLAVGRPGILTPQFYHPVLDCFMRALPYTYRGVSADAGSVLRVEVAGECGGAWFLYCDGADRWRLVDRSAGEVVARVAIPQDIAWRIFTKGIDREAAAAQVQIEGDLKLGRHVLGMKAIIG
jgi:uncharacterized protein (TIGR03083 family)